MNCLRGVFSCIGCAKRGQNPSLGGKEKKKTCALKFTLKVKSGSVIRCVPAAPSVVRLPD